MASLAWQERLAQRVRGYPHVTTWHVPDAQAK